MGKTQTRMESDGTRIWTQLFLWMIEEIGEAISIIKKKGEEKIMTSVPVRDAFVEELADVLMYYNEILLRYNISPREISDAYQLKHNNNLSRNYICLFDYLFISS